MMPLVWLLWKRPEWRVLFAGLFVLHAVAVVPPLLTMSQAPVKKARTEPVLFAGSK